jgi:DNA repair ATPase RecN
MQSLDDDERKKVLGEVLADELKAIAEYVKDMPAIKEELHQVHATVNEVNERLSVIEHVVRGHEADIKSLKR